VPRGHGARAVVLDSLCDGCRVHLETVRALLDQQSVVYVMNPRLVRGLDYYCRTAFEVIGEGLGAKTRSAAAAATTAWFAALGAPTSRARLRARPGTAVDGRAG